VVVDLARYLTTYLVLSQIVRQIGNHDLRLGRHAIFWRSTLARTWWSSTPFRTGGRCAVCPFLGCNSFVGDVGQRLYLARYIGSTSGITFFPSGTLNQAMSAILVSHDNTDI